MPEQTIDPAVHRQLAVQLFNHVWTLLDKPALTAKEEQEMIHAAHASRHHWGVVGGPKEWSIGEWQISRVYADLNRPEPAIYHARRAIQWAEEPDVAPFFLAYGYEALARAYSVAGDIDAALKYVAQSVEITEKITGPDDRKQLLGDLATVRVK